MRINQYLARCGVCSRRGADKLINDGDVLVDGLKATLGMEIAPDMIVTVNNRVVSLPAEHEVWAYYKPVGVTCTEKDTHAKRIVTEEMRSDRRLTYAGRLDKDSEGLLIMTDDGELINAMMKGANLHEKEYEVRVNKPVTDAFLADMSKGVYLKELNQKTRPCKITKTGEKQFNIVLTQGLNRQIRRMCETLGFRVVKLKRTRVMNVLLRDLQVGASRKLENEELETLYLECNLSGRNINIL